MFKRKNKNELINFNIIYKEEYIDEKTFIPDETLFNNENLNIKIDENIKKNKLEKKKNNYHIFLNKKIEELKETSPDKTGRERIKMAISIWKELNNNNNTTNIKE